MRFSPELRAREAAWRREVSALAEESHRAFLIAYRVAGSSALAEEAVQEAYAQMLQHPLQEVTRTQALYYLFKTVRNIAINSSRSSQHRKFREEAHAMIKPKSASSPADLAERAEAAGAARAALSQLPLEEREAVSLCCEQDLTQNAAADVLGIPERTVAHRVERGLAKLQGVLAARGFAALTPLAVGEGLRELGVPPARTEMLQAIRALTKSARASLRMTRRAAASRAAGNVSVKVTCGLVLAAGAAAGIWVLQNHQAAAPQATPAQPPAAPAPKPVAPAAEERTPDQAELHAPSGVIPAIPSDPPLYFRWSFENGPAHDIRVLYGEWSWQRGERGAPGLMAAPFSTTHTWLTLPTQVPKQPLCLSIRMKSIQKAKFFLMRVLWQDGQRIPAYRCWYTIPGMALLQAVDERIYFIDRFILQFTNGKLHRVAEAKAALSFDQLHINMRVSNWYFEWMELRTLRPEELTDELRNPLSLVGKMTYGPDEQGEIDLRKLGTTAPEAPQ